MDRIKKDEQMKSGKEVKKLTIKEVLEILVKSGALGKDHLLQVLKLSDNAVVPKRMNVLDSGLDLYAARLIIIHPGETKVVPTGIAVQLPKGCEGQVRSRSSVSLEGKLLVHFGTIDNSYNKEVGIIVTNLTDVPQKVEDGSRIAQLVVAPVNYCKTIQVDNLDCSDRGGFGSTGRGADDEQ